MKQNGKRLSALFLACALALSLAAPALAWEKWGEYTEGMIPVTEGDKWGYANASGSLVIPLRFASAEHFYLGSAMVKENGKYGLIRQDGLWLLEPVYDELTGHNITLGYGVYIGRRDGVCQLLSITPFLGADGEKTNVLIDGMASITVEHSGDEQGEHWALLLLKPGAAPEDGRLIPLGELPALLKQNNVPGWAFPFRPVFNEGFSDVTGTDWFEVWVNIAQNVGLMEGPGDGKFYPYKTLTVGEVLKLAAVLDSASRGRTFQAASPAGRPWYTASVDYCVKNGLITETAFDSYERPITRAEMAQVFAATAPMKTAEDRNAAAKVQASIPDVAAGDFASAAIFALYTKGIVSGSDKQLTFRPNAVITRSEAAAIVARLARPEQRITLWPSADSYRSAGEI